MCTCITIVDQCMFAIRCPISTAEHLTRQFTVGRLTQGLCSKLCRPCSREFCRQLNMDMFPLCMPRTYLINHCSWPMKATLQSCSFVQLFGIRFVYLCWFLQSWPCLWLSGWLWTWTLGTFLCLPFLDTSLTLRKSSAGYLRSFSICRKTWCSIVFFWFPNTCGSFGIIIIVILQENKAGHRFTGKMPCERQRCFNWHCGKRDQRKFCQPRIATIAAIEIEHVGDTLKVKNILEKLRDWKNSLHYISQTTSQQWSKSNFIRSYDWKCMTAYSNSISVAMEPIATKHTYIIYMKVKPSAAGVWESLANFNSPNLENVGYFPSTGLENIRNFPTVFSSMLSTSHVFWMLPPACLMRSLG